MTRAINSTALELIKSFEAFRAEPYRDQAGVLTQGYGETHGITADSPPITEEMATAWLLSRLEYFEHMVEENIKVPLNDNQFGALVSLVYNTGTAPLTHTLGSLLNADDYEKAADQFLLWDKLHIDGILTVSQGLLNRRIAEKALFEKSVEGV